MDEQRYFPNPYRDYNGDAEVYINQNHIRNLIKMLVDQILTNTRRSDSRGDLYVGDSGIAYMFLRLWQTNELVNQTSAVENAHLYISRAKENAKEYSRSRDERCAFLCGNAGIYAVSAAISYMASSEGELQKDLHHFESGFEACKPINFSKYGSDELLVGRAGFLSGVYWLNKNIKPVPFDNERILEICRSIVESGRQYATTRRSSFPLMYQYHGTEYLGAAHGLCSILHMLLESPWFKRTANGIDLSNVPKDILADIKNSLDSFVAVQDAEGNFPCDIIDVDNPRQNVLLHWCHGAPGAIYLLIKAYLLFNDEKYLNASIRAADIIWEKGLLKKGPGICHGVAGNGYVFLILYRLTKNEQYLHRSMKFMDFLTHPQFMQEASIPDCPYSLYEALQEPDGNFPIAMGSKKRRNTEKRLVHWCHGAPGLIYLLGKAYLLFKDDNYLRACRKAADLIWHQGLLRKGAGICHGVAGNGYAFLVLYRLTGDQQYLYRANKFVEFLTADEFRKGAFTPDRPNSLYEGIAGTVCFLIDMLRPEHASFPFMDIF